MLSVIIPSRDRAGFLRRALGSLRAQTLAQQQFEVLVIDNGSTDDTSTVVAAAQRQAPNVRYIHEPRPGLHAGRHRGLKEAASDLLVFADDDIRADAGWLAAIAENFSDSGVVMVGGNNYPDFLVPPPLWLDSLWRRPSLGGQAIAMLSLLSLPDGRREISPRLVWGCNFSIRRTALLDAGGFHPDAMPEELIRFRGDGETHVSRQVAKRGLRCVFDSRASVYHAVLPERMTIGYFRKRAYNQGISDSYTQLRGEDRTETASPRRLPEFVRRGAHGVYARARDLWLPSGDSRELTRAIKAGRQEGLAFHRMSYRQDAEVRNWVHKADYF